MHRGRSPNTRTVMRQPGASQPTCGHEQRWTEQREFGRSKRCMLCQCKYMSLNNEECRKQRKRIRLVKRIRTFRNGYWGVTSCRGKSIIHQVRIHISHQAVSVFKLGLSSSLVAFKNNLHNRRNLPLVRKSQMRTRPKVSNHHSHIHSKRRRLRNHEDSRFVKTSHSFWDARHLAVSWYTWSTFQYQIWKLNTPWFYRATGYPCSLMRVACSDD